MTNPRVVAFLAALDDADPDTLCSPPGLGGLWKARHIRSGLIRRVLVKTEDGIVFARIKSHGVCTECARGRDSICTHCNCIGCVWQREVEERNSPPVGRDRILALVQRLKDFEFRAKRPVVSLSDD